VVLATVSVGGGETVQRCVLVVGREGSHRSRLEVLQEGGPAGARGDVQINLERDRRGDRGLPEPVGESHDLEFDRQISVLVESEALSIDVPQREDECIRGAPQLAGGEVTEVDQWPADTRNRGRDRRKSQGNIVQVDVGRVSDGDPHADRLVGVGEAVVVPVVGEFGADDGQAIRQGW